MADDAPAPVTTTVTCKACGSTLSVHMDRYHADARLRQMFACPACATRQEGVFGGRVVQVIRKLP